MRMLLVKAEVITGVEILRTDVTLKAAGSRSGRVHPPQVDVKTPCRRESFFAILAHARI